MSSAESQHPVALITGAGRRIGRALSLRLHTEGYRLLLHYHRSATETEALRDLLNTRRPNSAWTLKADLNDMAQIARLCHQACDQWQRLDVLINNASSFYPTPLDQASGEDWDRLFNSNARAPFFIIQGLANLLRASRGCIVNIADIHAQRPLHYHSLYCMAKAANIMLTRSLALELAPEVRVNGIAPGAILWPESPEEDFAAGSALAERIPLGAPGGTQALEDAVIFLLRHSSYITGHIINVDGGRSLLQ